MSVRDTRVKALGDQRIGGYLAVWGDAQHTDLEGDYFTRDTNFWLDTYKRQPVLFNHAMGDLPDGTSDLPANFRFGTIVKLAPDDNGLWIEAQIDEHNEWVEAVLALIEKGVLHWSSGSVPHLVKGNDDGWLESWPIIEGSTTPTPAEPRKTDVVRLKHFVNQQVEGPPGAQPEQGARRANMPDVVLPSKTNDMEEPTMTLTLTPETVKAWVRAYVDTNADVMNDAIATVKQEGEGALTEMLRPLAEELATMAGVEVEEALSYLVQYVAEKAAAPESEPEPEPAMEDEIMSENATLAIEPEDLQKMLDQAVAKAVAGKVAEPQEPGYFRKKNIGLTGRAARPFGLGSYIKAVRDRDHAVLTQRHQQIKAQHKALGINPDTSGGYLVPTEQSNQIIELMRSTAKVLPLCRTMPMNRTDTLTIPKLTGGATADWFGENTEIDDNDATFGQIILVAKKLGIFMKISNELLEDSDPAVDTIIREDMARAAASEIDRVILEGSGVGNEPRGVANAGATTTALNALCTFANLNDTVYRVEAEDVAETPPWAWVINPREKKNWRELEDTEGQLIWVGAQAPGNIGQSNPPTMLEYPVYTTTEITIDTDNSNETKAYFGQWNDVIVGMRKSLEIVASNQAGDSFQYDQTWIRAILRMDVGLRHDESIEILTDVRDA